jgi:hypothetical protein
LGRRELGDERDGGDMSLYTLCISRHLSSESQTPYDHPSVFALGQMFDWMPGDQVDKMNSYPEQRRIFYFKTCELTDGQVRILKTARENLKVIMLNCFSVTEKEQLMWPGTMPAGLGGSITWANIVVEP